MKALSVVYLIVFDIDKAAHPETLKREYSNVFNFTGIQSTTLCLHGYTSMTFCPVGRFRRTKPDEGQSAAGDRHPCLQQQGSAGNFRGLRRCPLLVIRTAHPPFFLNNVSRDRKKRREETLQPRHQADRSGLFLQPVIFAGNME